MGGSPKLEVDFSYFGRFRTSRPDQVAVQYNTIQWNTIQSELLSISVKKRCTWDVAYGVESIDTHVHAKHYLM